MSELVIDCGDPARLAAFWCEVLGSAVLVGEHCVLPLGPTLNARAYASTT